MRRRGRQEKKREENTNKNKVRKKYPRELSTTETKPAETTELKVGRWVFLN